MLGGARRGTTRAAFVASAAEPVTRGKWYSCNVLLRGLTQDFEDLATAFGAFIQAAQVVGRPRHLPRRRHLAAADQAYIRDGVMGGATRAGGDQRRAVAREASDSVDACGLNGFGDDHRRQDGGEATG